MSENPTPRRNQWENWIPVLVGLTIILFVHHFLGIDLDSPPHKVILAMEVAVMLTIIVGVLLKESKTMTSVEAEEKGKLHPLMYSFAASVVLYLATVIVLHKYL